LALLFQLDSSAFSTGFWVEPGQELLQKWYERVGNGHLHPCMEITGVGLMLGAGTILAKMTRDGRGGPTLALDDAPRAMALLATAYERPVEPYVLAKLQRACELWNADEKALAHIHLAHARLPPCNEDHTLRLFVAEELLESGVTPTELMKAQGFGPATLALLKFNPDQPRVPSGSGRESGEWTSGDANITPVAFREKRGRHRRGGGFDWIDRFLELFREPRKEPALEEKPPEPEVAKPESKPPETPETENLQPPEVGANKLHHIFDKKGRELDEFLSTFDTEEAAFHAVEDATRAKIKEQNITGQYKIQIEIAGHKLGVGGRVMPDGTVKIGTAYPWKD
jgi:hypothetical protein